MRGVDLRYLVGLPLFEGKVPLKPVGLVLLHKYPSPPRPQSRG